MRNELRDLLSQKGDTFEIDLIAGSDRLNPIFLQTWPRSPPKEGCFPKQCCNGLSFIRKYPCVLSKDVAADYYIYNLAIDKTYTTTLPLMKGAPESYHSTIEASHDSGGSRGLDTVALVVRSIYLGHISLPPYLKLRSDLAEYYKTWTPPPKVSKQPSKPTAKHHKKKPGSQPVKGPELTDNELIL